MASRAYAGCIDAEQRWKLDLQHFQLNEWNVEDDCGLLGRSGKLNKMRLGRIYNKYL